MGLFKIGNDYIDPAEIAAAAYCPAPKSGPARYYVALRGGGNVCLPFSPEELEALLTGAGALAPEEDAPAWPEDDIPALLQLREEGYRFLARDGDGKLFSYRHAPELDGVYWTPVSPADDEVKPLGRDAFGFVAPDDKEPFDIQELYDYIN